jgi:Skp family chaperone for outer membrane proteins
MKATKQLFCTSLALAALSAGMWAQTDTSNAAAAKTAPATPAAQPPITAADVQALKDALAAQQKEIQALQDQLQHKDQAVQQAQTAATDAATKATDAANKATAAQAQATQASSDVADLKNVSSSSSSQDNATLKNAVMNVADPQQDAPSDQQIYNKQMEGPLTIHFKGINITPGGFAAAEFVRRSRALGADITTPFNSLTMPGAAQSNLPEFFASARQSRPTVYIAAREGKVDFSAYVSGDFLSSGVTSTATQTNSYTLRLRQAWGQAKFADGWSILGGQMWSLVTENKAGIGPSDDTGRTNDARPMTIDPQYNVGFLFARQPGIRLTKSFGDKVAVAFAVENPQATVTTSGNTNDYLLVQQGANNSYNNLSTYGFNPSPDLIAKIAFDPGFGHYEIFGLADRFTDRVYPCEWFTSTTTAGVTTYTNVGPTCPSLADAGTATSAYNSSKSAGGFGANARWTFFDKHIVFGLHGFGGSGVGRYGAAQLSDVAINPDGTVHPIKNLQGLATLEWHGKKLDVYSYVGTEYDARTYGYDAVQSLASSTPVFDGYGAPSFNNTGCYTETVPGTTTLVSGPVAGSLAHCSGQTRAVTEGTIGFWYRFHNGPRGKYQWGAQYSYVNRATWSGDDNGTGAGLEPHGLDNMIFTSFRYYLP